jgi:hypothetical protein
MPNEPYLSRNYSRRIRNSNGPETGRRLLKI